jgi:hypothetical protein
MSVYYLRRAKESLSVPVMKDIQSQSTEKAESIKEKE